MHLTFHKHFIYLLIYLLNYFIKLSLMMAFYFNWFSRWISVAVTSLQLNKRLLLHTNGCNEIATNQSRE